MSRKIICDGCGKEIDSNVRYQLKLIYKEMDWGIEQDKGNMDLCSKKCVEDLLKELDERKERIEEKDRKGETVY